MSPDQLHTIVLEILLALIVIPWVVWVTKTLFNQNKQIALLEQIAEQIISKISPQ